MEGRPLSRRLRWALAVISVISGVVWVLAASGLVAGEAQINAVYLITGAVNLVAGGFWLLSLRAA